MAGSTVSNVYTDKCYTPSGPYSQAVKANGFVFLTGQIAIDENAVLIKGTVTEKATRIMQNTANILEAAGSSLDKIVKVVVYALDCDIMSEFNAVYAPLVPHKPARSMVQVSRMPLDVDIEVDFIAAV
ncbi:hypothetical protein NUW58_g76 [Xylaria curta]|uniref:Uncharacterized protein n=2 Tax=Xylaria curta TaxID=42375 RepID=A0ACC1PQN7_9PEZI|nr:hypothetical protein NUW58_g1754 [Xylaria curta]KAJ2999198.1 hypothetical protein NUW58_g76 [Xylaria curta]